MRNPRPAARPAARARARARSPVRARARAPARPLALPCALLLALALLAAGCRRPPPGGSDAPGGGSPTSRILDEAQLVFADRCALCHGPAGRGDGARAPLLSPPPRDLADPAWQRSVTDAQIRQILVHGGKAVGKSEAMPGYPDLVARPELSAALVTVVRGLERR